MTPLVGQATSFDGSPSSDPDGKIVGWSWDFGDGSAFGSGSQPTHAYGAPGGYDVSLSVTDDAGNVGSTAQTVSVSAPAVNAPSQQPPATPQAPAASLTRPPLTAHLQVPQQRLGTVLARGITLKLGANAPARATLRISVGGAAARLLRRGAPSRTAPQRVVVRQVRLSLTTPGMVSEVVRLTRRTTRALRHATRVVMSFQLVVVDRSGRATTLSARVVLRARSRRG